MKPLPCIFVLRAWRISDAGRSHRVTPSHPVTLTSAFLPFLFFFLLPAHTYAQDCPPARYEALLQEAKQAAEKGQYDLAINKLQSAKTCRPEKEEEVNREILRVFKEVNKQKNIAEEQKKMVMISARASHNAALAFQTLKTDATLALGISEYNYRRHPNESMAKATYYSIICGDQYAFYENKYRCYGKAINIIKCSRDGEKILSMSDDSISIISNNKFRPVISCRTQSGERLIGDLSDDGKILTGGSDGKVIVWDSTGRKIKIFELETPLTIAVMSQDGGKVIYGNFANIYLYDFKYDRSESLSEELNLIDIGFVSFSPDNIHAIIGCMGRTVMINIKNKNIEHTWSGGDQIQNGYISAYDHSIAIINAKTSLIQSGEVEIYDSSGNYIRNKVFENYIHKVVFSPDGTKLLIITDDENAVLWNIQNEKTVILQNLRCGDFTPDGKYLISGNNTGELVRWYLHGKIAFKKNVDYIDKALSVSPKGGIVYLKNDTLYQYDENIDSKVQILFDKDSTKQIVYSNDEKFRIMERKNGQLYISTDKNKILKVLSVPFNITKLGISPHGAFAWALGDSSLSIYTIKGEPLLNVFSKRFGYLNNVDFSDDEKYMTFALDCCTVALYSTKGNLLRKFKMLECDIEKADHTYYALPSFSSDEKSIITYFSLGDEFVSWTKSGQIKKTWHSTLGGYSLVTEFSPNGKYYLQGGYYEMDTNLYTSDGEKLISYGYGGVYSITFSANSNYALLLSDNACILVYTPESYMGNRVYHFSFEDILKAGAQIEPDDFNNKVPK